MTRTIRAYTRQSSREVFKNGGATDTAVHELMGKRFGQAVVPHLQQDTPIGSGQHVNDQGALK